MNNYLPLYYLNACNNKSDEKGCGLLGSAYMLNMLNNGSDMGDMASVFPLVALNKFLNNSENRKTVAGLLPLFFMNGTKTSLFGGNNSKKKNNGVSQSDFISNLEEITNIVPQRDRESFVENKAVNVIASTRFLVEYIQQNFTSDQSEDLLKRLFNSLRTGDEMKFRRGIKQIKESK